MVCKDTVWRSQDPKLFQIEPFNFDVKYQLQIKECMWIYENHLNYRSTS